MQIIRFKMKLFIILLFLVVYGRVSHQQAPSIEQCRELLFGASQTTQRATGILQVALEIITESSRPSRRTTPHDRLAKDLLLLLTGQRLEPKHTPPPKRIRPAADEGEDWEPSPRRRAPLRSPATMRRILELYDQGKSFKTINRQYPWYSANMISYFRRAINGNNSPPSKMRQIEQHALEQVTDARNRHRVVRGWMIRGWALQRAREISALNFKASNSWLSNFQKRNKITSRKGTDKVTRASKEKAGALQENMRQFIRAFAERRHLFRERMIWNFDHSQFNYEMSSDRTLSWKGELDTQIHIDQANKVTHSYTVLPIISRDGRTIGKLLLCFQEKGNCFGSRIRPRVEALEREYGNVAVICTTSGKMPIASMNQWVDRVVRTAMVENTNELDCDTEIDDDNEEACMAGNSEQPTTSRSRGLILGDSYGGNTNAEVTANLENYGMQFMRIPEGSTGDLQPLDVAFFRQYKYFIKRVFYQLNLDNNIEQATDRYALINLHSLAWNQFSAPAYSDLIRYAWRNVDRRYSSDELSIRDERGRPRMTKEIQFSFAPDELCQHEACLEHAFVRCAHCGKLLCLKHFLERACYHDTRAESEVDPLDFEEPQNRVDEDYEDWDNDPDLYFPVRSTSPDPITIPTTTPSPTTIAIPTNTTTTITTTTVTTPRPQTSSTTVQPVVSHGDVAKTLTKAVITGVAIGTSTGALVEAGAAVGGASEATGETIALLGVKSVKNPPSIEVKDLSSRLIKTLSRMKHWDASDVEILYHHAAENKVL